MLERKEVKDLRSMQEEEGGSEGRGKEITLTRVALEQRAIGHPRG